MQFSYKKSSSSSQSSSNIYVRPTCEFDDEQDLSKTKIDAGLSGKVDPNGEWQIEIQGSIDEREHTRQLNRETLQSNSLGIDNGFVELDNKEEYPSLLGGVCTGYNGPPLGWSNSNKIGKGKKKNDFPELFLSAEQRASQKAAAAERRSQLTLSNRVNQTKKSTGGNSSKKTLLNNISLSTTIIPSSKSESWNGLEVKVKTIKKKNSKNNLNTSNIEDQANINNINSNNEQFLEDDIALAIALSESRKQSNSEKNISQSSSSQLSKSVNDTTNDNIIRNIIPTSQTLATNNNKEFQQPNINNFPPTPPPQVKEKTAKYIETKKPNVITSKQPSISGWGNALKDFGSSTNHINPQKKIGLSVFKTGNKSLGGNSKNNKEEHKFQVNMNDKFEPDLNDWISVGSSSVNSINNDNLSASSNNKYVSLSPPPGLEEYPTIFNNNNNNTNESNNVNIKNISNWGSKSIGGSNDGKKKGKKSSPNLDLKKLAFGNYTK
jgi:hypothetical protein